jgi:hypothetical protein
MENQIYFKVKLLYSFSAHTKSSFEVNSPVSSGSYIVNFISSNKLLIEATFVEKVGTTKYNEFKKVEGEEISINSLSDTNPIKKFFNEKIIFWTHRIDNIFYSLSFRLNFGEKCYRIKELTTGNWSLDNTNWYSFDYEIPFSMSIGEITVTYDEPDNLIVDALKYSIEKPEPIYHELFRDAINLINLSPRSSLVISVSSLEVCIKHFLIKKIKSADWLIDNLQSPPVEKILYDFLPQLGLDTSSIIDDKETVRNLISERNNLVHKGTYTLSTQKLQDRIKVINKVIYLLEQEDWAKRFL